MSSTMRCRREVMEISFARWNRLQTATPWFRKGGGTETAARTTCQDKTTVALPIPRSGLVQFMFRPPIHNSGRVGRVVRDPLRRCGHAQFSRIVTTAELERVLAPDSPRAREPDTWMPGVPS